MSDEANMEKQETESEDTDQAQEEYDYLDAIEKDLSQQQSLPGKLLSQVDPASSAFIVASDPLTKCSSELSWHRVAANSILCYTRGSIPRLYKLNVGGPQRPEDYAFFLVDFWCSYAKRDNYQDKLTDNTPQSPQTADLHNGFSILFTILSPLCFRRNSFGKTT
jgi:hypothetical protein